MDDADLPGTVTMRVGVILRHGTMCGPTRMTDSDAVELCTGALTQLPIQCVDPPDRTQPRDSAVVGSDRQPDRVVATILKPAQCNTQILDCRPRRPAGDDAAHQRIPQTHRDPNPRDAICGNGSCSRREMARIDRKQPTVWLQVFRMLPVSRAHATRRSVASDSIWW